MLISKKLIFALTTTSVLTVTFDSSLAENPSSVDTMAQENITFTGESLQGIEPRSVANDTSNPQKPVTAITVEREEPQNNGVLSTGNDFLDSLMAPSGRKNKPIDEGLNKNQGDRPTSRGGKVPLVNF